MGNWATHIAIKIEENTTWHYRSAFIYSFLKAYLQFCNHSALCKQAKNDPGNICDSFEPYGNLSLLWAGSQKVSLIQGGQTTSSIIFKHTVHYSYGQNYYLLEDFGYYWTLGRHVHSDVFKKDLFPVHQNPIHLCLERHNYWKMQTVVQKNI